MIRILSAFLLALTLAGHASAQALPGAPPPPKTDSELSLAKVDSVPRLLATASKLKQESDWRRYGYVMERVLELRPHAGSIRIELAAALAMQDKKSESYDVLVRMLAAGYGFDISKDERFAKVRGTKVWDYILETFAKQRAASGAGKLAVTLPAGDLLIESLAWDAKRKQLLAGSVRTGEISLVGKDGALKTLVAPDAENQLWGVFDLVADAERDLLWVVTAAIPHVKHAKAIDYGKSALLKFRLSDGKLLARVPVAEDGKQHILSAIATNPRGDVFVADSSSRQVFKLEGDKLRLIVQNPKLTTIRAIAASADNKTLYFADYELGLFGLDLASGRAFDVGSPQEVTLFGIESLYWYDGRLLAIQNGFPPPRSVRFELSPDGHKVVRAQSLDAAQPEFGLPTRGVVANDRFWFIANTQKDKYDSYGIPKDVASLQRPRVYESDARYAWDTKPGQVRTQ